MNINDKIGIKVMINSTIVIAIMNGIIAFDSSSRLNPDMLDPTNRFTPTGGVMKPIAKATIIIIPKWIGS